MDAEIVLYFYLIFINLLSGIIFAYDKFAAVNRKKRVKVTFLHTLEGLGGAFSILALIYILRHKNKRSQYYMRTWIFMTLWVFLILLIVLF